MIAPVLIAALTGGLGSTPRYAATEIPAEPGREIRGFWTADMNGDGRGDALLGVWSAGAGRELVVHLQRGDSTFAASPDRRVRVKSDIVAFSVADLRDEPGDDLLLFTPSAGFSLSTARSGYAGNARRILDARLVCGVPDRKDLPRLDSLADLDGDGRLDILVPEPGGASIWTRGGQGAWVRRARVPLPLLPAETARERGPPRDRQERGRRRSITIQLSFEKPTLVRRGLPDRVRAWTGAAEADEGDGNLLRIERWVPAPWLADADGDGRLDVVVLAPERDGTASLSILLQRPDGTFQEAPDAGGGLGKAQSVWPRDLDGDGRFDLVVAESTRQDSTLLRLHLSRGGRFETDRPDQVLKLSGYGVLPRVADLDGDGGVELLVTSFRPLDSGGTRGSSVARTLVVYRRDRGGLFGRRPVSRSEETFRASEARALGQRMVFDVDLTGEGRRHALHTDAEGALVARRFDDRLRLAGEPFWQYVPRKVIQEIVACSLDGDPRTDLVLRHTRSLTVLVSR